MNGAHAALNLFSGYRGRYRNCESQSREHKNMLSWEKHLRANLLLKGRNFCSRLVSRDDEVEVVIHIWTSVEVLVGLGCQPGVGKRDLGIGVPKDTVVKMFISFSHTASSIAIYVCQRIRICKQHL